MNPALPEPAVAPSPAPASTPLPMANPAADQMISLPDGELGFVTASDEHDNVRFLPLQAGGLHASATGAATATWAVDLEPPRHLGGACVTMASGNAAIRRRDEARVARDMTSTGRQVPAFADSSRLPWELVFPERRAVGA
ncbi:hypothetical protein RJ55_06691 [Drechmeria coniospora]|nr:hypothetical protein RJ55_06691 [Drechmeria coniospora]